MHRYVNVDMIFIYITLHCRGCPPLLSRRYACSEQDFLSLSCSLPRAFSFVPFLPLHIHVLG